MDQNFIDLLIANINEIKEEQLRQRQTLSSLLSFKWKSVGALAAIVFGIKCLELYLRQ